jgi:hypothetical protein
MGKHQQLLLLELLLRARPRGKDTKETLDAVLSLSGKQSS